MLPIIAPDRRKRYLLTAIFWFIAILLAALQGWNKRFILSSEDSISYLDIGDTYLRGDWTAAVNGYWSPLYPWILALTTSILRPSTYWEFPVVKLANLLIYLFTLFSFELLLQTIIFSDRQKALSDNDNNRYLIIPEWIWIVLGYALFIWSSLQWTTINSDTPDMCVAAFVYLASAIVLRSHAKSANWFDFILLGVVLGFGYLTKAAMFPIALLFLAIAAFTGGNIKKTLLGASVSFLVFALIVTPYIIPLSIQKGRFTFGDNGKLNYAWNVNPGSYIIPDNHWQGSPPGSGTPEHPTRQIFKDPPAFEFATPLGGTYPTWYDPSYWYEGLTIKFNLANQIKVIRKNLIYYRQLFLNILILFYLILICSTRGMFLLSLKALIGNWRLLVPAAVGLMMYAIATDIPSSMILSQPSPRYIAPFIVLLFTGVFSSLRFPNSQTWKKLIAFITIVVFTIFGFHIFFQDSKDLATISKPLTHIEWQVAETVGNLGIQPGEKVATFVDDYYGITPHVFWARLARVKIVAEITNAKSFWEKSATIRSEVIKTIAKTGAKIIVHRPTSKAPDDILTDGWRKIGNTRYYVYLFQTEGAKN